MNHSMPAREPTLRYSTQIARRPNNVEAAQMLIDAGLGVKAPIPILTSTVYRRDSIHHPASAAVSIERAPVKPRVVS
jgi:hypothetical protein